MKTEDDRIVSSTPPGVAWHTHAEAHALAAVLASSIAADLERAVEARGTATLVVPGGTSPIPVFAALADSDIRWSSVHVLLGDDRWVPSDHVDSNERLARETLLVGRAAGAKLYGYRELATSVVLAAQHATHRLHTLARPFDVQFLGMGEDGHIASLFPHMMGEPEAFDTHAAPAIIAAHALQNPRTRITFNLSALLAARRVVLQITGDEKRRVLARALSPDDVPALPVTLLVRHASAPVEVHWTAKGSP